MEWCGVRGRGVFQSKEYTYRLLDVLGLLGLSLSDWAVNRVTSHMVAAALQHIPCCLCLATRCITRHTAEPPDTLKIILEVALSFTATITNLMTTASNLAEPSICVSVDWCVRSDYNAIRAEGAPV
jgi:hypothetical protein